MTKIYLVRHGETDFNKRNCYYGWTDCRLSETGVIQSEKLHGSFKEIQYDIVLSSDLKRALETADIINRDSKELLMDKRLRELNFGQWEGMIFEEISGMYNKDWNLWLEDWENSAPTEGECVLDMFKRIQDFLDDILAKYKDKSIVIVSHNGSLRMIAAILLGLELKKIWCFSFEHGKYSLLEVYEDCSVIKCINNI